jgi:RNA polymerase sigma factor (sigma-70 family)
MVRGIGNSVIQDVERLYAEGTTAGASDEQLLSRFATARDRSSLAFETIVRRHGPMVLETCRRLLGGDHHAAEDAFQATFLVLARRANVISTSPCGSLGPWLHEVACRTARKARVARLRRETRESSAIRRTDASVAASRHSVDELDEYRVLHEEVSRLPEKYRVAIVLCYLEGLTHDQAAGRLRWPVGTVRGYLARVRDLLRTRLVRRGVAPAVAIGLLESGTAGASMMPPLVESVVRSIAKGSAASTVAALTGSVVRSLALARARRSRFLLMVLVLGAGGAGLVVSKQLRSVSSTDPPGLASIAALEPATQAQPRGRVDLHGDPLPDGAVARLGTSRFNHGNNVVGVAFTPDGKGLVSFGGDGFVRVWDPSSGRLERSLISDGSQGSREFALSADGKRMLTVERSHEANFRLWDFETGRELRRVPVPNPKPYLSLMSYSPDRKAVATVLSDNSIAFRDGETLAEVRRMKLSTAYVRHIAFSPDGRLLAGTSEDRPHHARLPGARAPRGPATPEPSEKAALVIWDVAKAAESRRFEIEGCHPECLVFSPDGKRLVAPFCDSTIRCYDPLEGRELGRLKVEGPGQSTIAFSRDGRTLASADDTAGASIAVIHLWDVAQKTEIRQVSSQSPYVFALAFSPDGKTLASPGSEKVLRLWDVATGREINPVPSYRNSVACLVVSPSDISVMTGGYDNAIRKWDASSGRELAVVGTHPRPVYDLAISPDGRFLLSSDIDATVRLWDIGEGRNSHRPLTINPGSRGRGVAFSPDGRLAVTSGKISDVVTGQEAASLLDENGTPFRPWAWACFTPDNTGLLATDGGAIWLWNVSGGKPVRKIAAPRPQIMSIAVSPDGRFLVVGVNDAVRLWHLATGREVKTNMRHDAGYVVAAFSPDGRLIVSGCGYDLKHDDPPVRVWEAASGKEVRRFNGHLAGVYSVAFFPDGRRVASAGSDAMAMVWDLALQDDGRAAPVNTSAPLDLEKLWAELDSDAARAYRANWRMSAAGDQVVPFLAERLKPIQPDDPERDTSLGPIATGETLRRLRAIAILEKVNSPAARRVLERMSTGLGGARETRDARAALRRASPRE